MGYEWIAGVIIAGMVSASPIVTAAIVKMIPRNTNGLSKRVGKVEQEQAANTVRFQEILRRLKSIEDKME
jgi:hypothetical protein